MIKRKVTADEKKVIFERERALHPTAKITVHDETDDDGQVRVDRVETKEMPSDWTPPDA